MTNTFYLQHDLLHMQAKFPTLPLRGKRFAMSEPLTDLDSIVFHFTVPHEPLNENSRRRSHSLTNSIRLITICVFV